MLLRKSKFAEEQIAVRKNRMAANETNGWYAEDVVSRYKKLEEEGYTVFHVTVVWNLPKKASNSPDMMRDTFEFWYRKEVLRYLDQTRHPSKARIADRPFCTAFVEISGDVAMSTVKSLQCQDSGIWKRTKDYGRLHHHALIAAKGKDLEKLASCYGLNKLNTKMLTDPKTAHKMPKKCKTRCIQSVHVTYVDWTSDHITYPLKQLEDMDFGCVFEYFPK